MIKEHLLINHFQRFISRSSSGTRVKKNGERIKTQSIKNYTCCKAILLRFEESQKEPIKLLQLYGNNRREYNLAKKYYEKLYRQLKHFMQTQEKFSQNYTGQNIKIIRTFFNWINKEGLINVGLFHKDFYILTEEKAITLLSSERLKFLMFDEAFEKELPANLIKIKDVFVFGCVTGLRYSDLCRIKKTNIMAVDNDTFIKLKAKKTNIESIIKLSGQAKEILWKYRFLKSNKLPTISLTNFNAGLKKIGKLAKWNEPMSEYEKTSGRVGKTKPFYQFMASHLMRKTSITHMLSCGVPEFIVKKISGHANNSKSFYRYVKISQRLIDKEVDKFHNHFEKN